MKEREKQGNIKQLKDSINDIPKMPGVYLWKDEDGQIIYIGKAKSLRDRLSSYFSGEKDKKTTILMHSAWNIETIITSNEYEALLLENTLIKQHSPKYNISLKDGKTYPVIRITNDDFPRIFRTRRIIDDNSQYYGPFTELKKVDSMLELIDKLYPLRKCRSIKKRKSPCMYYHINRCRAPCCGRIEKTEYGLYVERIRQLLSGNSEAVIMEFTEKMHKAAHDLKFEWAAQIRNAIRAIEDIAGEDSSVVDFDPEGRDYIAWAGEGVMITFTVFSMRDGKMTGRELYRTQSAAGELESLELFITSYYDISRPPPAKIYLQSMLGDLGLCAQNLEAAFAYKPSFLTPAEKHHAAIMAMAFQNAAEDLRKRLKERGSGPALDELAACLQLPTRPHLIEGFDVSHLDGKYPVASLVSFRNGVPDKKNYRYFRLRSVIGIIDDFAAIGEAVKRRYSRLLKEGLEIPDLVLVDGGIGQANAAKTVIDTLGIKCCVAALAKREEEIWLPHAKNPLVLSRSSEALKLLQFIRDETHRFATGFNQRLRSKDLRLSMLESVKGIGKQRAAEIIKTFGSIENIAAANPDDLALRCRISKTAAKSVCAAANICIIDSINIT